MTLRNIIQLLSILLAIAASAIFISPWLGAGLVGGIVVSALVYFFWFGLLDAIYCEIVSLLDRDSF